MIGYFSLYGVHASECKPLVSQQLYLVSVKGHCTKMSFSFMVQCSSVCCSVDTSSRSPLPCFVAFSLCCPVTIWAHLLLATIVWTLIFPISCFFLPLFRFKRCFHFWLIFPLSYLSLLIPSFIFTQSIMSVKSIHPYGVFLFCCFLYIKSGSI